ncbi:uncharacterized protein [Diadema setosum]|uniref:uncharacterized protein n=1 Tax=Diadema setosum TaxID=31175 RepID=UPI003B3B02BB
MFNKMAYQRTVAIFTACLMVICKKIDCQIPDDVVVVDRHSVLLRGLPGKLKCQFSVVPQAVYWLKEPTPNSVTLLVSLYRNVTDGSRYRSGDMTIDSNYSLIIHTVNNENAGRYYCRVADIRNNLIQNYTDVSVREPDFLTVDECSSSDCSISYNGKGTTLQCQAVNVPQEFITIYWLPNGVNQKQNLVTVSNNEGTQNIYATAMLTPDLTGTFACVAEIKSTRSEVKRITVTIPTPITTSSSTTVTTTVTAATLASTKSPASKPRGSSIGIQSIFCYLIKPSLCRS